MAFPSTRQLPPPVGQAWTRPPPPYRAVPPMTASPAGALDAASQCARMRAEESAPG